MWVKDFVRKYLSALVRGYVPFGNIIDKLKREYNAVDIPTKDINNLAMHRFNAVHLPSNEILGLAEDQLRIKAIKIPITAKSQHYTSKNYVPIATSNGSQNDFIYLAYEEQVGYHYSNSSTLFLEVALARGIPEEDIEKETENYTVYLHYLQRYLEDTNAEIASTFLVE